jgi:hypothetical protein
VYIAKTVAHQAEFFAAIDQIAGTLAPHVLSITPTLGTDWNGESAVFFDVILADDAAPRLQMVAFTNHVSRAILQRLRPLEDWGVLPYFNFLTQSEQRRIKEATWA